MKAVVIVLISSSITFNKGQYLLLTEVFKQPFGCIHNFVHACVAYPDLQIACL